MKKLSLIILTAGALVFATALFGAGSTFSLLTLLLTGGAALAGGIMYNYAVQMEHPSGIRNNGIIFSSLTNRGIWAWLIAAFLIGFYVCWYWAPQHLKHVVHMLDPLSRLMRGKGADIYFLYSSFYSFAVLIMGIRMILKYRHSRYQVIRMLSVIFCQLVLAWIIPSALVLFQQPEYYFSYFWPLTYNGLFPSTFESLKNHPGGIGIFFFTWGAIMSLVMVPVLTWLFGKRWYCSWVCGCGGLANTLGDPWRQLSSKKLKTWKFERFSIHTVLVLITLMTLLLWAHAVWGGAALGKVSGFLVKLYGFIVGAILSGVVGTGVYPILGTRVWCRFFCPQAAILGICQKFFSRFRITTNGAQCISCGNCSKYCEMGIDVRWYAQRGQDIVRASCVGCGICSTVCPRGVLNLEIGPKESCQLEPLIMTGPVKGKP